MQLNELCTDLLGEILRYGDVAISKQVCIHWNRALEHVPTPTLRVADYVGSIPLVQWASDNGAYLGTIHSAALNGRLELIKWLRMNDYSWDEWTSICAVQGGHLDVLKWLRKNGCPWNEDIYMYAANDGHLEILKWARANGSPWDKWACVSAAERGHLHILQWLRDNNAPWDDKLCTRAARNGHLEVLKWARENGFPWDIDTCRGVRLHSHTHEWAQSIGCTPYGTCPLIHGWLN